jgi:hypothetical protein
MYEHDLSELNQYTGAFMAGSCLALVFCCYVIGLVGNTVHRFHLDYRKVNRLDEREDFENGA